MAEEQQEEMNASGMNDENSRPDEHAKTAADVGANLTFTEALEASSLVNADQRHLLDKFIVIHSSALTAVAKIAFRAMERAKLKDGDEVPLIC